MTAMSLNMFKAHIPYELNAGSAENGNLSWIFRTPNEERKPNYWQYSGHVCITRVVAGLKTVRRDIGIQPTRAGIARAKEIRWQ